MAIEEMFTELPTVSNSLMGDIICAVQGYVSPSSLGLSTQQTLSQVFSLFQSNIILFNSGDPNGSVAGSTYQFLWDTLHSTLYICVTSGTTTTAVWVRADINDGYTTTVTAAGTTILTILSTYWQFFTGNTTQTLVMPVESTLAAGMSWRVVNNSTGVVTIQSSGLNTIVALPAGGIAEVTCILNSGTSAASWNANVSAISGGVTSLTGTVNQVLVNGTSGSATTGPITLTTPQDIATTSSPTFSNLTLTNQINGANGLEVLQISSVSSAATFLNAFNAVSGGVPGIIAAGSGADISAVLQAKGAEKIIIRGASGTTTPVRFDNGTAYQHMTLFNFANTSATRNVTWQDADGTVAYLSDVAGAVTSVQGTANQVLVNGTTGSPVTGALTLTLPQNIATTSAVQFSTVKLSSAGILDSNANPMLTYNATASAVNNIRIGNGSTGNPASLGSIGSDTDVGLFLFSKGVGSISLFNGANPNLVCLGVPSSVNNINVSQAATGNPPFIAATGSDTNVILQLIGKGTGGVSVQRTATNSVVAAGYLGEIITSTSLSTAISNGIVTNITSISLTAGQWLVWGNVLYNAAGGTIPSGFATSVSSTSATFGPNYTQYNYTGSTGNANQHVAPMTPFRLNTTTTIFLIGFSTFTVSTMATIGTIYAQRM